MNPNRIVLAEEFGAELNVLTNEIEMWHTERNRAASATFGIALDHHAAIVFLIRENFLSSAFALLRILFEAYLRGLWLKHCASDEQVSAFFRGCEPPKTMVTEIEATEAFASGVLSRIKKENWSAMCAFTHTGGLHLQRWQSRDSVEPTFSPQEVEECLNCAELFGAMSGLEMVQLSKSGANGLDILQLMKKRWP